MSIQIYKVVLIYAWHTWPHMQYTYLKARKVTHSWDFVGSILFFDSANDDSTNSIKSQ